MDKKQFFALIKNFNFKKLFIELGWDNFKSSLKVAVNDTPFEFKGIAHKRGFVILLCRSTENREIPLSALRKKIEHHVTKLHQEHLIIYTDSSSTKQIWQFIIHEKDKPKRVREIPYNITQDPEALYQRARGLLFTLDEEEKITLIDVTSRFRESFGKNTEKVTKKFYTEFKNQHTTFLGFIEGIDDALNDENNNKHWYASLMLNRLMFCYFIQKRGYLNNDLNYLQNKLKEVKTRAGKNKFYDFYREFLLQLFHQGLGQPEKNRKLTVELGKIPYLNGGLFDVHELEKQFKNIKIKDNAFEKIFNFFDMWEWTLDIRPDASGREINPDVIGYIFEKYINDRASMGAYYTKEDITDYIGKSTIVPFLFDKTRKVHPQAFDKKGFIWTHLKTSGDIYIYDAVKKGIPEDDELFDDLPAEIEKGFQPNLEKKIVKETIKLHLWKIRMPWNKKAPAEIALPTETYRELIERRKRYAEIKVKIENGKIHEINDFITYNLDIRQFAQDILENTDDPDFIRHFFKAIRSVTILDPTCGSGAFLFAALNILEPLYEACIQRMEQFTADEPRKYKLFHEVLAEVNSPEHPNLQYYIYKSIILNNLYGVDIMHEAVEIAKLRLFLKMVGAVDMDSRKPNFGLEPLPDIDFNIRAGNTLVGFATEEEFKTAVYEKEPLFAAEIIPKFEDEFEITSKAFKHFQNAQIVTDIGTESHRKAKLELQKRFDKLNEKLNGYLASTYGITKHEDLGGNTGLFKIKGTLQQKTKKYNEWLKSHQPFHWFAEFYEIINGNGGFDVVIGNPPYVKTSNVSYYVNGANNNSSNLYALIQIRCINFINTIGHTGLIVPMSVTSIRGFKSLRETLFQSYKTLYFTNHAIRPLPLFTGISQRVSIVLASGVGVANTAAYTTYYLRTDDSKYLLKIFTYQTTSFLKENDYLIPKIGDACGISIWKKLNKKKNGLIRYFGSKNSLLFFKDYGETYWVYPCNFSPYLNPLKSFNDLLVDGKYIKKIFCGFNSTTHYIFYSEISDCWHFGKWHLNNFPIDFTSLPGKFDILSNNLEASFKLNRITRYDKRAKGDIYEYKISKSKPIIDQIDTILAQHYGFTEEELDFIINYDIKYRIGEEELEAYVAGNLGKSGESK